MGGEIGEAGSNEDGSPRVGHVHRLRLDPHDLVGDGHRGNDHGKLAEQEDEGTNGVDGSNSQSVGGLEKKRELKIEI